MNGRLSAALLCTLLLLACPPAASYVEGSEGADLSRPLTVEDCVTIALQNNYNVAIARNNVESSRAATSGAWSGVLPDISANAYWDRLTQGPTEQLTLNERTGEIIVAQTQSQAFVSYSMGLNATQSLFNWSALQSVAQAKANLSAARHSSRAAENDITYDVKSQFYNLVKAQKLLEVSEKSLERSRSQLDRAQSLFELGSVAKSDVLRAKVDLAQSELDLITARNNVELEKTRLAKIMGLGLGETFSIQAELTVEEVEVGEEDFYKTAAAQRPDLLAAAERVRGAKAGVQSAKGGQYPSFFGFFNWRWRDDRFPSSIDALDTRYTWDVGMGISVPIFDGMLTRANIGEARASLMSREKEYQDMELSVALEVKEALLALEEARQRIRVSEDQFAAAEESYKLAEEQYEVGLGTILELTEAGVELTSAENQRVEAITAYKVAVAQLDRARGANVE
jgi:outer membrane protein